MYAVALPNSRFWYQEHASAKLTPAVLLMAGSSEISRAGDFRHEWITWRAFWGVRS